VTGRDRIIVMVVAAAAVLAGFWFLVLAPKRAEVAKLDADIVVQQQRLQTANAAVATAAQAKVNYRRDYATVATLGKAVPADDDMPSLLYQLDTAAKGARIDFQSLALSGSGGAAAAPAPAATTGAETKDNTSPESGTEPAAAATPAPAATAALPPGATIGAAGLATMPFSFVFTGSFFDLQRFLSGVQGLVRPTGDSVSVRGRLLTIEGISLTPGAQGMKRIKAALTATSYIVPADEGLMGGATPDGPAAATPAGADPAAGTGTGSGGSDSSAPAAQSSSAVTPGASS
jgi:Tfp pilus assembly protein PilO